MRLSLESTFRDIDAERFMELLLSDELTEHIMRDSKGAREILHKESLADGRVSVRTRVATRVTLPGPLQRLLPAGELVYYEVMSLDPAGRRGQFHVRGEEGDERVRVEGHFAIADTPSGVHRRTDFDIRAKIFGLGGAVEALIATGLRASHASGDRELQRFIDEWRPGSPKE